MSNYPGTMNPTQMNPALLQAFAQAQAAQVAQQAQQGQQAPINYNLGLAHLGQMPQQPQQMAMQQPQQQPGQQAQQPPQSQQQQAPNVEAFLSTFQRLQSQASAKIDQQRLGMGHPNATPQMPQQINPQQLQQQASQQQQQQQQQQPNAGQVGQGMNAYQMLQQMGSMGGNPAAMNGSLNMMGSFGGNQGFPGNFAGMNMSQLGAMGSMGQPSQSMQPQQPQMQQPPQQQQQPPTMSQQQFAAMQQQHVPPPQQQQQNAAMNPYNMHTTQQGLGSGQEGENEQGRRQALQSMLSNPSQHMQNQQQQMMGMQQQPQPQPQGMQQLQQQQQQLPNAPGIIQAIELFLRGQPEVEAQLSRKYNGDRAAMMMELSRNLPQIAAFRAQQQQQQAAQQQVQQQQVQQQQPQQQQQPPPPPPTVPQPQQAPQRHIVGVNGQVSVPPPTYSGQQGAIRPPQMPPRAPSEEFNLAQNPLGQQFAGIHNDAQRQIHALQMMKERQSRQGLVTPQMPQNPSLPLVSPQAMSQPLGMQAPQQQPQHVRTLSQVSQTQPQPPPPPQAAPMQQNQMPPARPVPQRSGSSDAGSSKSTINALANMQPEQLFKAMDSMIKRGLNSQIPGQPSQPELVKTYLLQLIAEAKRRGLPLPTAAQEAFNKLFGNANLAQMHWQKLAEFAARQQQLQAAQQNNQQLQQNGGQGTQANPIDVTTPSMLQQPIPQNLYQNPQGVLPGQNVASAVQQAQQLSQAAMQQRQHQRTPSIGQQQQQQQQPQVPPPQQAQPMAQQRTAEQPPVWAGMDFTNELLNFTADRLLSLIRTVNGNPSIGYPLIGDRQLDLHALFTLVHKNGGSLKFGNNLQAWQAVGGALGFAEPGPNPPTGPPKASLQVAMQIMAHYKSYLAPTENHVYSRIYQQRMQSAHNQSFSGNQAQAMFPQQMPGQIQPTAPPPPYVQGGMPMQQQQQMPQGQMQPPQQSTPSLLAASIPSISMMAQPSVQQQMPQGMGMSSQFLDAVAKGPAMSMTEQQRKILEEARRASMAAQGQQIPPQHQPQMTPGAQMQQLQPGPQQQTTPGQQGSGVTAQMAQQSVMALRMLKGNVGNVAQFIRNREEGSRAKFPSKSEDYSEEDRVRYINEIRALQPVAREIKSKINKYLLAAAELSAVEDLYQTSQIIGAYTLVFVAMEAAEQGRYALALDNLAKLGQNLEANLLKVNTTIGQAMMHPEYGANLQRYYAVIDSSSYPSGPNPTPPLSAPQINATAGPSSVPKPPTPIMPKPDEISSRLPPGLRVEDLKPPPPRRSKKANGQPPTPVSTSTPAAVAQTPGKTPQNDSPAQQASVKRSESAKRKREATGTKAGVKSPVPPPGASSDQPIKRRKSGAAGSPRTATGQTASHSGAPAPTGENALQIDFKPDEQAQENARFFDALKSLQEGADTSSIDPLQALSDALAAYGEAEKAQAARTAPSTGMQIPSHMPPMLQLGNGPAPPASTTSDDDLFAQFIDGSNFDLDLPTPELICPDADARDGNASDTSPESVRTVGTVGPTGPISGPTPVASAPIPIPPAKDAVLLGQPGAATTVEPAKRGEVVIHLSPQSQAYSGAIFTGWYEDEAWADT